MWEWRVFASRLDALDAPVAEGVWGNLRGSPVVEEREDLYLVAPRLEPTRGLKVRGGDTVELKLLDRADGELELWRKVFVAGLELPPWRTRELARALKAPEAPVPVRPVRSLAELLRLLRDVGAGEPRAVRVRKVTRERMIDGAVRLERSELTVDGQGGDARLVTLALEAADPEAVRVHAARVARPADAFVGSYPAWLARRP